MATIRKELLLNAAPEAVWDVIRDVGAVHRRLAPVWITDVLPDAVAAPLGAMIEEGSKAIQRTLAQL